MSNKTFDDLIELMLIQAKAFLEEIGEFFPYGSVLTSERELKTIGVYNDDDNNFNPQKAITILENDIEKRVISGDILIGVIGVDVLSEGKDALMVKATDDGKNWQKKCYLYEFIDGQINFKHT